MSGLINELIELLTEETSHYDALISLSTIKKDFIINNNIDELKKITTQENTLAGKIQRLEKNRLTLVKDIANVLNEKESNITLTNLVNIISGQPEEKELDLISKKLRKSLNTIKELNDQNRVLIENALDYIDFSMNVIRSTQSNSPSLYSPTGEEINLGRNLFDKSN